MASLLATPVSDWNAACATIITNASISTGFVDEHGNHMPFFTNYTWGVDKNTCYQYCDKGIIYQTFDFNLFANSFTNWLLPWLALTAQLPFEAKSSVGNLMSLSMAVGSPALITFSLTITILNRIWVRRDFGSLQNSLNDVPKELRHGLRKRLRAAQYLLQESQQVPMRASQVNGWLSSLIVLDENDSWWKRAKKDLKNTRRGYTFSLLAQIGMAFLAYTLTISISLNSSPLGNSEGSAVLLTAAGSIWIWMIPVILGWIMCGMQARASSIMDALNDKTHQVSRIDMDCKILQKDTQHGICSRSGLIPRPRFLEFRSTLQPPAANPTETESDSVSRDGANNGTEMNSEEEINYGIAEFDRSYRRGTSADEFNDERKGMMHAAKFKMTKPDSHKIPVGEFPFNHEKLRLPSWLGFSIEGDEALEGPVFNYARLFTFREFSSTIMNAFNSYIENLKVGNNQKKNAFEVAALCQLDKDLLQAYTPWQKIDSMVWHQLLIAAGVAIFVQWGTTGPAIMIAYLTPTVGLGCRSGGYLIYGVLATISWLLILCSFILSHAVSLRYQEIYMDGRNFVARKNNRDPEGAGESIEMLPKDVFDQEFDPADLSAHRRTSLHSILAFLTVVTRITGKLIAAANACWIIISALFEYSGVYENCYCGTNADVLGARAWVVLFATAESFSTVARNYWIGGVIFSFGVCFVTYFGLFLGCGRNDVDEYDG